MFYLLFCIITLFVLFNHVLQISAIPNAQDKCREHFHMDAESQSHYLSEGCRVNCLIHGKWREALEKNGNQCHLNPKRRCHKGNCSTPQLGHIDIWFDHGEFRQPASYYVVAYIRNSSESIKHPVSIPNCAAHCESRAIYDHNPVWKQACANNTDAHLFTRFSRVAFDVWNRSSSSSKRFVGGGDFLISDQFPNGTNGRAYVPVELFNSNKIYINISFTYPSGATSLHLCYLASVIALINALM